MKSTYKKEVVISIELSLSEARILAGLIQNPLCDPADEPPEEADFRRQLFDCLNEPERDERNRQPLSPEDFDLLQRRPSF